jgi:hypothetical protein
MRAQAPATICFLSIIILTGCTIVRQHRFQNEYKYEINLAKALLIEVLENEHPSLKWYESIGELLKRNPDKSFYSLGTKWGQRLFFLTYQALLFKIAPMPRIARAR